MQTTLKTRLKMTLYEPKHVARYKTKSSNKRLRWSRGKRAGL